MASRRGDAERNWKLNARGIHEGKHLAYFLWQDAIHLPRLRQRHLVHRTPLDTASDAGQGPCTSTRRNRVPFRRAGLAALRVRNALQRRYRGNRGRGPALVDWTYLALLSRPGRETSIASFGQRARRGRKNYIPYQKIKSRRNPWYPWPHCGCRSSDRP